MVTFSEKKVWETGKNEEFQFHADGFVMLAKQEKT